MKTQNISFSRQIIMSVLLASILLGFEIRPTQAQWTVFDPSQYVLQVEKKIEEATRWVETINHYISMYEKAAQQYQKMVESVTNLRGILDKVEEQVMRHKQLITTYATLGRLIRGTFELKRRIETTITSQIQSVVNISRRLGTAFLIWMRISGTWTTSFVIQSVGGPTRNLQTSNGWQNLIQSLSGCFTTAK